VFNLTTILLSEVRGRRRRR